MAGGGLARVLHAVGRSLPVTSVRAGLEAQASRGVDGRLYRKSEQMTAASNRRFAGAGDCRSWGGDR